MNEKLPKAYDASKVEDKIYKKWEESGLFRAEIKKGQKPFVISMPPPNATGILHIGHAMFVALQDLMTRFHRLKGESTLWLPGTDHASIATQAKVEKILLEEENKTRHDLGREIFLEKVDEYVANSRDTIRRQIRKLGASCDWSRERFTLDEGLSNAVREIFVRMYNDGLIYRGHRIVNWCPRCSSTLSDDEVEHKEARGKLYYIKYGPFVAATTRPETKLGDTGVAVHPKDKRYKKYLGQEFDIDLAGHKIRVKVFSDKEVDQKFGSGVIGVTPAHSHTDYDWAKKNNLKIIQVIGPDGKMTKEAGKYAGLLVSECRREFVKDLDAAGLLEKKEDYVNNLSICYRCATPIEPLTSKQWFVDVNKKIKKRGNKSLKELSLEVVKSGKIEVIPDQFEKIYFHWMDNLRDWCISRQIWYGHRIPVWYCEGGEECAPIVATERPGKCPNCGSKDLKQDPDTLDTWFSSGLWTFSTLGWPEKTEDLKYFHPTTVMETAYDILFFWVARMIIMTQYALGEVPFKTVYLHGLVRDKEGRKMSKSLGNVIDPLEMIEKFGTDAVRMSLIVGNTPGNDSRLYEEKIAGFRNFVNKLWNISRFVMSQKNPKSKIQNPKLKDGIENEKTLADRWILSRWNQVIGLVTKDLDEFRFSQAGEMLRAFTWEELADWYLEIFKIKNNKQNILFDILDQLLILWHPFMPFVTEEIYSKLPARFARRSRAGGQISSSKNQKFIMVEKWPGVNQELIDKKSEGEFELIREVVVAVRNARAEYKIPPTKKISAILSAGGRVKLVKEQGKIIESLAQLEEIKVSKKAKKPKDALGLVTKNFEIYLLVSDVIDIEKEKKRLAQEIKEAQEYLMALSKKLENKEFVDKAPEAVVEKEKEKLTAQKEKLNKLELQFKNLG